MGCARCDGGLWSGHYGVCYCGIILLLGLVVGVLWVCYFVGVALVCAFGLVIVRVAGACFVAVGFVDFVGFITCIRILRFWVCWCFNLCV